ncbi:MAG: tail fiber protein [Terracidiphilus sp.]|nr:tail fiber protein [Terracidiphilus sp.]
MADQFVAEIRVFPFNFAPVGWAQCNGQLLAISQNTALFSLVGTFYGGDGKSTFALPNLQGCFPINQGQGPGLSQYFIGETGGSATVTLLQTEIPSHSHVVNCAATEGTPSPAGAIFGGGGRGKQPAYAAPPPTGAVNMSASAVAAAGGNQPHDNMPPFVALNFCIAMQGIYPSRS